MSHTVATCLEIILYGLVFNILVHYHGKVSSSLFKSAFSICVNKHSFPTADSTKTGTFETIKTTDTITSLSHILGN